VRHVACIVKEGKCIHCFGRQKKEIGLEGMTRFMWLRIGTSGELLQLHYITLHYITFPGSIVTQNDCRMWNKSYKYKNTYTNHGNERI
jgi:hypothetical protein